MRILFEGYEETCLWYLPIVKSKVKEFIHRINLRKNIKQETLTMTFYEPRADARVIYHFADIDILIRAYEPMPTKKEEKKKEVVANFVVCCGDEVNGYNYAVCPLLSAGNSYGRVDKLRDLISLFPPLLQSEAHERRYSLKSDSANYGSYEIIRKYYSDGDGKLELFSSAHVIGPLCDLGITVRCPEIPLSAVHACSEPIAETPEVLDFVFTNDLTLNIVRQYSSREVCTSRPSNYISRWLNKKEVTFSIDGAINVLGFGADIYKRPGSVDMNGAFSQQLANLYVGNVEDYICFSDWLDDDLEYTIPLRLLGNLVTERMITPAGTARILKDSSVWEMAQRVQDFHNADPDTFVHGMSEEFSVPISSDVYTSMMAEKLEYMTAPDGQKPQFSMYSYSHPGYWASITGKYSFTDGIYFVSPLFKYEYGVGIPGITSADDFTNTDQDPVYNNIEAKNISFSVNALGVEYNIYFKSFLEATFTLNAVAGEFEKSNIEQIAIGAARFSTSDAQQTILLNNLKDAFETFRQADINASRVVEATDPFPTKGSVFCYLYEQGMESPYLEMEMDLFDLVNAYRISLGLSPYSMNIDLCVAARLHADDMARNDTFLGHIGTDGSLPGLRINGTGFCGGATYNIKVGENCGFGYNSAQEQFDAWKASTDGHHEAMKDSQFLECGIATSIGITNGVRYWVMVFAGDMDLPII